MHTRNKTVFAKIGTNKKLHIRMVVWRELKGKGVRNGDIKIQSKMKQDGIEEGAWGVHL